jgi:hypothetical protein
LIFGLSFDDEIFIAALVAALEDQFSLGMILQILLRWIYLGSFLMVAMRIFVLAIFVLAAMSSQKGDSCSRLPSDIVHTAALHNASFSHCRQRVASRA